MSNKELLEMAAKAAGVDYECRYECPKDSTFRGLLLSAPVNKVPPNFPAVFWNPLSDDGDALRLAVKLRMDIAHFESGVRADVTGYEDCYEDNCKDPYAATRRAIVRAAAEIGKAMP